MAPGRLAITIVEGRTADDQLPQTMPFCAFDFPGIHGEPLAADLDLGLGMVAQIEVPGGVVVESTIGANDNPGLAILKVDEWPGVRAAGLTAEGGQEQDLAAAEATSDSPAS